MLLAVFCIYLYTSSSLGLLSSPALSGHGRTEVAANSPTLKPRVPPSRLVQLAFLIYPRRIVVDQTTGEAEVCIIPEIILRPLDNSGTHVQLLVGRALNADNSPIAPPIMAANMYEGLGWFVQDDWRLFGDEQQIDDEMKAVVFSLGTSTYLNSDIVDPNTGRGKWAQTLSQFATTLDLDLIFQTLIDSLDIVTHPHPPPVPDQASKIQEYFRRLRRYHQTPYTNHEMQPSIGLLVNRRLPQIDPPAHCFFGVWNPQHPLPLRNMPALLIGLNFLQGLWFRNVPGGGDSDQLAAAALSDPGLNLLLPGYPAPPQGHLAHASDSDNEEAGPSEAGVQDILSTVEGFEDIVLPPQQQAGADVGEQVDES
ncbi:hypothetical protein MMC11_002946 [Xylographa trunciseda]|nr:hypothetical protein [Xylographa trunciseda]